LKVNDDDATRERGDAKQQGANEEDIDYGYVDKGLEEPTKMNPSDASLIGPRHETAEHAAEDKAAKDEHGNDKRGKPFAAQIIELLDGLGEDQRIGVLLKVPQHGGPKYRGNENDAKRRVLHETHQQGVWAVQQHLPGADRPEVGNRDGKKHHEKWNQEEDVGGEATEAQLPFEPEKRPEHVSHPPTT
jgi:hypothetical protein